MSQGPEAVLREALHFPRLVITLLDYKLWPRRHCCTYFTSRQDLTLTSRKRHTQIRPQPEILVKAWLKAVKRPLFLAYTVPEKNSKNSYRPY